MRASLFVKLLGPVETIKHHEEHPERPNKNVVVINNKMADK
jgi:hypothetical protein